MDTELKDCVRRCLDAAYADTMAFPEIVRTLIEAGFERYAIDFQRASATYYLASGESVELPIRADDVAVDASFDGALLAQAIREAQAKAPGYSYAGFCRRAKAAGCAGYLVSFPGRRAIYIGRTGDIHVEHFSRPA